MILYRIFATLAAPMVAALLVWRVLRGRETWGDLGERLGAGGGRAGALWLHGASNGELTSARHLVSALLAAFPDRRLLITCNTVTARAMVRDWALDRTDVRLAPLDLAWVLARFRARWQPTALVILENELWPNRIAASPAPVFVVGARMSARSARRWGWLGTLPRRMLAHVDRLWPQDAASGERFLALGLPAESLGLTATLKSGVTLAAPSDATLAPFRACFIRHRTLLAASTHAGEEATVLQAFQTARQSLPDLRLILAPRHPRRGAEVLDLIRATGLAHAQRSAGQMPGADCAVYLADTLGEMPLWYALAGITFVGGSLAPRGGHTPFEPAQVGSAILHGPDVVNFADSYAALQAQNAAREVRDAVGLTAALVELAALESQGAMARRARNALADSDAGSQLIAEVIEHLRQRKLP